MPSFRSGRDRRSDGVAGARQQLLLGDDGVLVDQETRAAEDDVLRRVVLACLSGDSRHPVPAAAPQTWNDVGHVVFRRMHLSDETQNSASTSVVILFSHEDLPHVVLGCRYRLTGSPTTDPSEVATQLLVDFRDLILHRLGRYSLHQASAPAEEVVCGEGPRLQWVVDTALPRPKTRQSRRPT